MARTIKKGLEYFPFDVDFFQDIRIRKLIKYQSGKAVTVYALLLCTIYKNGYYAEWDKELPFIISEQSGYTEAYIQEVIDCCMNIGLFSKELFESSKVLTSKGIQDRYRRICASSRRSVTITEYNLLPPEPQETTQKKNARPVPPRPRPRPIPETPNTPNTPSALPHMPSPAYSASIEEEVAEMKQNRQWKETVCMRYSLTPEQMDFYLADFALKCHKQHTSIQDAKSNFCYWLQNQLQKQKEQKKKPQSAPDDYSFRGGFGGQDQ